MACLSATTCATNATYFLGVCHTAYIVHSLTTWNMVRTATFSYNSYNIYLKVVCTRQVLLSLHRGPVYGICLQCYFDRKVQFKLGVNNQSKHATRKSYVVTLLLWLYVCKVRGLKEVFVHQPRDRPSYYNIII